MWESWYQLPERQKGCCSLMLPMGKARYRVGMENVKDSEHGFHRYMAIIDLVMWLRSVSSARMGLLCKEQGGLPILVRSREHSKVSPLINVVKFPTNHRNPRDRGQCLQYTA